MYDSKLRDGFIMSPGGLLSNVPDIFKYFSNKTGRLANSIVEVGGFLKTQSDARRPDIQLHLVPVLFDDNGRDLRLMSKPGYSCHVCVLRPQSRGSITLKSRDPRQPPEIDFNLLSAEYDRKVMIDGMRMVRKIFSATAFSSSVTGERHPGADAQSDEAMLEKIRQRLGTIYHPVGTCKMGTDPMAVVDSTLKVHGVEGLRVVDASIMPTLISGNTNAPTIAIAEKAADLILQTSAESPRIEENELEMAMAH
jgi:choline dehydrogenase-like flavoprotein